MTRFMMSLADSVDLVIFAYQNGRPGDLFIQKAPAATIGQLAKVLNELFNGNSEIKHIGTRHGEKKHECLANREELVRSQDLERYFRIQSDMRDLNYDLYFSSGEETVDIQNDYTSENTNRLSDSELRDMLLSLDHVKKELKHAR